MTQQCRRCKEEFDTEDMMYNIETPNINIQLCLDCALEIEDDLMHLAYNTTSVQIAKRGEE